MKKIIRGRLYDTTTAELVADYSDGEGFAKVEENLYRKKTGEFFLHGSGGPQTKYVKDLGDNSYGWGEVIIPESEFDVMDWVECHCDADTYIKLFGEVEE